MEKLPDYNFSWTVSLQILEVEGGSSRSHSLEVSLEEAMDLSRDRQILELEHILNYLINTDNKNMTIACSIDKYWALHI
jgi:hypothetical protein